MVDISSLGIGPSEDYARAAERLKEFYDTYHIPPSAAGIVAIQTVIRDLVPKPSAVELLMGTFKKWKPWPLFELPPDFVQRSQSRYLFPSLGPREKQEATIERLHAFIETAGPEQAQEGNVLINLLQNGTIPIDEMTDSVLADMLRFIPA